MRDEVFDVFIKTSLIDSAGGGASEQQYLHIVNAVEPGSYASRAGLAEGDAIVSVGGQEATHLSGRELWRLIEDQPTSFRINVLRAAGRRWRSVLAVDDHGSNRHHSSSSGSHSDDAADEPVAASVRTEDLSCCIAPLDMQAFKDLDVLRVQPQDVPPYGRGKKHNRYPDILPNPLTRVVLPVEDDDPETSYINANFVRGYGNKSAKEYIAAQGPTPNTVDAFIRMVWYRQTRVVVMVTGYVENGKVKCERYHPASPSDAPMLFGDISVRTDRVVKGETFDTSSLVMKRGRETLRVEHLWYVCNGLGGWRWS